VVLFLSGAEMQPERVRAAWPAARFRARARLEPRPQGAAPPPANPAYERWGILIDIPDAAVDGEARTARGDDGRAFTVVVVPPDDADPAEVLAAAKYWELPPPYVRTLARLAASPAEDYFY
jgi:hypothetical protein